MPKFVSHTTPTHAAPCRWRWNVALLCLVAGLALALDRAEQDEIFRYAQARYGGLASERVKDWFALMSSANQAGEREKLKLVNEYFNRIPNISDERHWASEDYWATPLELIATHGGDCEDFALAKFFTLRELGVPDERLRLTYVRAYLPATREMQRHMVLTYLPPMQGAPLILDNLMDKISPASERKDLAPTYSFEGAKLWVAKRRGSGYIRDTEPANLWQLLRPYIPGAHPPETAGGR